MTVILTTCAVFGLTVSEAKTVEGGTCAVHVTAAAEVYKQTLEFVHRFCSRPYKQSVEFFCTWVGASARIETLEVSR